MKAAVLEKNGYINYREIDTPCVSGTEVLVNVAVCGICGSDLPRVYDNAAKYYPIVLGHEFSGIVEDVGEKVATVKKGDHIIAAPLIPCMECDACASGDYALCNSYSFIGSRRNGAMADYVSVPEKNIIVIPNNLDLEQAATIEPSSVAFHALSHAKMEPDASVAVLGCGIIGLYTVQWAKILGATHISSISRGIRGLNTAKKLGADSIISTEEYSSAELKNQFSGKFDYVFECSGSETTMKLALELVSKKGTVCYVGTPKKQLTFSVPEWELINRKEAWITGSWMSYSALFPGKEWTESIKAMVDGRLKFIPEMIDAVYSMDNAGIAFESIHAGIAKGRVLLRNISEDR